MSVRILIDPTKIEGVKNASNLSKVWFFIKPEIETIEQLINAIVDDVLEENNSNFLLQVFFKNGLIKPSESVNILSSGDEIEVRGRIWGRSKIGVDQILSLLGIEPSNTSSASTNAGTSKKIISKKK